MFFVWLFFYGVVMLLSRYFSFISPWIFPLGLLINTLMMVAWLHFRQSSSLLSFKSLSFSHWKLHLFFLPYLFPVVYNLACFGLQTHTLLRFLCVLLAAVQEELFFRGILLQIETNNGYQFLESEWASVSEQVANKDNWVFHGDVTVLPPDISN